MKIVQMALLLTFFACNNAGITSTEADDTTTTATQTSNEKEHASTLSLNKGAKWKADENTHAHVANLNTLVAKSTIDATVTAYQAKAMALQNELDSLVRDCKMTGADHEALHLWLKPVLEDVKNLKKSKTADEGKIISERLAADVKRFNEYFQ